MVRLLNGWMVVWLYDCMVEWWTEWLNGKLVQEAQGGDSNVTGT